MTWTDEQTLLLIKLYSSEPCLWNTSISSHNDSKLKDATYNLFACKIKGFDSSNIREKINSLRSQYSKELKKIKESKLRVGGKVYTPSVIWFPPLDAFLRPFFNNKVTNEHVDDTDVLPRSAQTSDSPTPSTSENVHHSSKTGEETEVTVSVINRQQHTVTVNNSGSSNSDIPKPPCKPKKRKVDDSTTDPLYNHKDWDRKHRKFFDVFRGIVSKEMKGLPIKVFVQMMQSSLNSIIKEEVSNCLIDLDKSS